METKRKKPAPRRTERSRLGTPECERAGTQLKIRCSDDAAARFRALAKERDVEHGELLEQLLGTAAA